MCYRRKIRECSSVEDMTVMVSLDNDAKLPYADTALPFRMTISNTPILFTLNVRSGTALEHRRRWRSIVSFRRNAEEGYTAEISLADGLLTILREICTFCLWLVATKACALSGAMTIPLPHCAFLQRSSIRRRVLTGFYAGIRAQFWHSNVQG